MGKGLEGSEFETAVAASVTGSNAVNAITKHFVRAAISPVFSTFPDEEMNRFVKPKRSVPAVASPAANAREA
jgi:hypothetical protein